MPIDTKAALRIAKKLEVLPCHPETPTAWATYAEELAQICRSEDFARDLIRRAIEECERCPSPKWLRDAAAGLRSEQEPQYSTPLGRKCPHGKCNGDGWERWFRLDTDNDFCGVDREFITEERYNFLAHKIDWQKQRLYDGIKPCACLDELRRQLAEAS